MRYPCTPSIQNLKPGTRDPPSEIDVSTCKASREAKKVVAGEGGACSLAAGGLCAMSFNEMSCSTSPRGVKRPCLSTYRGTSLTRKRTPLGPNRRPMPRVPRGFLGGWAISCGRGTHVINLAPPQFARHGVAELELAKIRREETRDPKHETLLMS